MKYKLSFLIIGLCLISFGLGAILFSNKEKINLTQEIGAELNKNPQIIADLILSNPELFVQTMETVKALVQEEQKNNSLVILDGVYDSKKTLVVEYFNFGCHVCYDAFKNIKELKSSVPFQVALKHIHSEKFADATILAQFMEALYIENPSLVSPYIELVFKNQDKIGKEPSYSLVESILKELKLTPDVKEKLLFLIKDQKIYDKLATYRQEAQGLGISATPSFVIKGKVYSGLPPKDEFNSIIKSSVK